MDTMFDTLLQLPLFQGLAQEDFTNILGKVKLHFVRHKAGVCIIKAGEVCNRLVFVLKGEVEAFTTKADIPYGVTEFFQAPYLLEPQSMFGMNTSFVTNYTASAETDTVSISKSFVLNELFKYEIFRLNYMNIISNRAQNLNGRFWTKADEGLESHIANFILNRTERPAGRKIIKIKKEDLAVIVNDTRMGVSKALNNMQQAGLLELRRGEIVIPDAARLRDAVAG
ncbi:Crp/Fnr family transcriptional regulator [uncultured Bacteroides sp.]|uniref:Crp/Fnr family transcriptional regulator n=1 Tax=uncultured Bacteroides sp. TaxID=162156 RepID=UPI00261FD611|nr:Crp/Fnr family transcriptional regulator [uncultured Bacteroides sp.]